MTSSFTGGINAPFNVLLQRGLNLLDVTDSTAARQNIGAIGASELKTLTFGSGLVAGTYNATSDRSVVVDSTSTGEAGKVVKTDGTGDLTTSQKLNFGSTGSYIQRASGANGAMVIQNGGSGAFSLNNGSGLIQLVSGGGFQFTAATSGSLQTQSGFTVGLGSGSSASSAMTITGGLNADALSGTAISDSTTGTSSSVAASSNALGIVAARKLDILTTDAQSVASSTVTLNAVTCGALTATSGAFATNAVLLGQTANIPLDVTGTARVTGKMLLPGQPSFCWRTTVDRVSTTATELALDFATATGAVVTPRGASLSGSNINIGGGNAGRYRLTVSGTVSGNGYVYLAVNNTTNYYIWNGSAGTEQVSHTFLFDFAVIDIVTLYCRTNAIGTAFTVASGFTIAGEMIG